MTCEEYGFKGRGCIGILTENGLPVEQLEILSKDVEIDGEVYTVSSNIKYENNYITEISTKVGLTDDHAKRIKMAECLSDRVIPVRAFKCFYVSSELRVPTLVVLQKYASALGKRIKVELCDQEAK